MKTDYYYCTIAIIYWYTYFGNNDIVYNIDSISYDYRDATAPSITTANTMMLKKESGCFTVAEEKKEDDRRNCIGTVDRIDSNMATINKVVIYQDKCHKIDVVSSLNRNGEYYFAIRKDASTNITEDQIESFNNDNHDVHDANDNTVLYQDVNDNRYGYCTTTVRRPLSNTVPLTILLFRLKGWKRFKRIANQDQQLQRLVKQAKLRSFRVFVTTTTRHPLSSTITLIILLFRAVNRLVVFYQDVHHETRADNGGNDTSNLTSGYSTITISSTVQNLTLKFSTSINGEKYRNQLNYKRIVTTDDPRGSNTTNNSIFSTLINGEKYTGQSKYKDDYIKRHATAPATGHVATTTHGKRTTYSNQDLYTI